MANEAAAPTSSTADRLWVVGGLLGLFVYFNVRNPPTAFARKPASRRQDLAGMPSHHENEAHRYAARGTSRACSVKGLQALLNAQTAYVHAKESGNEALRQRMEKQRDEILARSSACCYGGSR